jgi:hypothetical protein
MGAWPMVYQPKALGGLGIPDIRLTNMALQTRWLWFRHTDDQQAWSDLPISMHGDVQAFFKASTYTIIGNGRTTSF